MPQLKEFQMADEQIGEPTPMDEVVSYHLPENGEGYLPASNDESE